jgi:hypothetical protein
MTEDGPQQEKHNPGLHIAEHPKILQQICSQQVIDLVTNPLDSLISTIGFRRSGRFSKENNHSR